MFLNKLSSFWNSVIFYITSFYLLTFPFINYSLYLYTGVTSRMVNLSIFIFVAALFASMYLFKGKETFVSRSVSFWIFVVYILFMFVSGYFGFNFQTSFWANVTRMTGLWFFVNLLFLLCLFVSVLRNSEVREKLIHSIIFSTSVYSVLALLSPEGLGVLFKTYATDGFTFGNSTFAGMYIFGAFILSLYFFVTKEKRWYTYLYPLLIIANPFMLNSKIFGGDFTDGIWGEARASATVALLAIVSLLCAYAISKIKDQKIWKSIVFAIFGFVIVLIGYVGASLLSSQGFVRELYLKEATGARPLVWEISDHVIAERPYLGWGIENFEKVFEHHYDNRLLQKEYGGEPWFDRAHNIFIDQMVDGGVLGLSLFLALYLSLGGTLLFVLLYSKQKNNRILAVFLLIYFGLHLLELQTAFDTIVSYVIFVFMLALAIVLFDETYEDIKQKKQISLNKHLGYVLGVICVCFFGWTFVYGLVPFVRTQNANGYMRTIGSSEKRLLEYHTLFGSPVDITAFLWRTSADLQRGIAQSPTVLNDPSKIKSINKEFTYIEEEYQKYLKDHPDDFRSLLNLADVLIYVRLFDDDKLGRAQEVLDKAITIAPQSPQAYWMKAVTFLYQAKFAEARVWAQKAYDLNPKIEESKKVIDYIEESTKTFPEIDLYFFRLT